jgi:hypothetical protein
MKTLFTLLSVFFFSTAFAQSLEHRVVLNSGLFHFSGVSAGSTTSIYDYGDVANEGSTGNSFGSQNGGCYGLSLNIKRVTSKRFFFGADIGLEMLQSKIHIDSVYTGGMISIYPYAADGCSFSSYFFMNLNPFAGYRFSIKKVDLDLAGGFDVGYCFIANESANATASNGTVHTISGTPGMPRVDFRPRIQLDANKDRFGAFIGYSFGLSNYKTGTYNFPAEAYARLFRFGITYLIK